MSVRTIAPTRGLKGEVTIPGDKSISHRSIMLGSIALGTTEITHFLEGADCLSTIDCFRKMGVEIETIQYPGTRERSARPDRPGFYFKCRKQRNYNPPDLRNFVRAKFCDYIIRR